MNTPAPKAVEALPELPEPSPVMLRSGFIAHRFTAEQMRTYARAALAAAQAEQAKPVSWQCRRRAPFDGSAWFGWYECPETLYEQATINPSPYCEVRRLFAEAPSTQSDRGAALSPQPPSPDVERQAVADKPRPVAMRWRRAGGGFGAWTYGDGFTAKPGEQYAVQNLYVEPPPQEAGDADAERLLREWFYANTDFSMDDWNRKVRDFLEDRDDAARSPQQEPKA